ncbi:MAG: ribonuclease H-like domain-containing protein [Candidatus Fervidibacter sp.]|uniref:ribonuclease H-like domain-containing protein n=1 Tax=Candidatus Fervidibacter sp. TaxID=3100871 RepID=UPI00404A9184
MLEATFMHLPGATKEIERKLWEAGVLSWQDFLERNQSGNLPFPVRPEWVSLIQQSITQLARDNVRFFAHLLPHSEHWRLYGAFRSQAVCLDIETTGLSDKDKVTVVGLYHNDRYEPFIDGVNLEQFPDMLRRFPILVTFNGSDFDIPFLRRVFPNLPLPLVHLDVQVLLKRLGIRGSQKAIEERLGFFRKEEVRGMTGADAVALWEAYLRGETKALNRLMEYNREDVVKLKELMDYAYRELRRQLGWW